MNTKIIDLIRVQAISGKLSKLLDEDLIEKLISNESLVSNPNKTLDHEDPKDRIISKNKINWIIEELTEVLNSSINNESKLSYESHWLHVHERNMSTNTHSHLPSKWSAACYLRVPENSGKICFISEQLQQVTSITPELGSYLIFPSCVKHFVTAHENDTPRVCLSINWS